VTIRSSIVIPVHNRAGLTRRCLDAVLAGAPEAGAPEAGFELIVVDDASVDSTPELLSGYREAVRSLRLESNSGFATASNAGAGAARGEYLVFLNNDTVPQDGWLEALVRYADAHPAAVVVGSKLLFPNDTIQHAGVVICRDGLPRHLYAGFPADHPAVSKSRRFQAVTAGCMLVRRSAFEEVGGFDEGFRNSLEDADLCLRLGERGHEVHYCHESVLYHLESVSRPRWSKDVEQSKRLFQERWAARARRDDFDYYLADGLLRLRYRDLYPVGIEISSELAFVHEDERQRGLERQLERQGRQISDLLRETVRLTAHIAELELRGTTASDTSSAREDRPKSGPESGPLAREELLRRVDELEIEIYELQAGIARALPVNANGTPPFVASEGLGYKKLVKQIRDAVESRVPVESTVLVISRGDDDLLELGSRATWHFPQDEHGTYSGHHPRDSRGAIELLEDLRRKGAGYLVVPETAAWWLDHYAEFGSHLRDHYTELTGVDGPCRLFSLHGD
jgi:GT2 family glycosyltransferase